jgi:16S rRNA G1207 methylase RsmC
MAQDKMTYLSSLRQDTVFQDKLRGFPFTFHTTWGLFSPKCIDEGSRLLMDRIRVERSDDCLDLGCGYGALGLLMARLAPDGQTTLVDKDFVAVDYSRKNAQRNGINNVEVLLSNGFSHVHGRAFRVIASNLPAKSGKELYYLFFFDALERLHPGGRLYLVTINGLRRFIERVFLEVFGNYEKLKQGRRYTLAMAVKEG